VEILLAQVVSHSNELSFLVSIFGSTVFKLYPGFLYKVCFIQGIVSLDQYVIHYAHPIAVLVLIWFLSKLASCSVYFTTLISKAAIPTICLILTLAYVSIADTSLQLFRFIEFSDLGDVFTYVSPKIKYFTDRHIAYFIVAMVYELVIVVGLPLLLLSQPFVAFKVNFTAINIYCTKLNLKPLLDQFQGCYKDKFRWLASIYLIGRQVILIITVISFSDPYIEQYLLMIVCVIISLLHYVLQPYKSDRLNAYDGIILHILLLIISLKIISFSNGFTTDSIIGITYGLYFLPALVALAFLCHYIYSIKYKTNADLIVVGNNNETLVWQAKNELNQETDVTIQ